MLLIDAHSLLSANVHHITSDFSTSGLLLTVRQDEEPPMGTTSPCHKPSTDSDICLLSTRVVSLIPTQPLGRKSKQSRHLQIGLQPLVDEALK